MLYKNNLRPAEATAGAASGENFAARRQNDALMYNTGAGEAEDFNSFNSFSDEEEMPKRTYRRPAPNNNRQTKKKFPLIPVIAAVAAAVLLIIIIACVALSGGKNITYTDNTYVAFADGDGNYFVAANGSILEESFEGEVEVIPSADKSFAYITDTTMDGINIYILEGKKLTEVTTSPVVEVVAYATLEPGVIFSENNKYYLYSEQTGEEMITRDHAQNMMISGDASTIVYTLDSDDGSGDTYLCVYTDGSPSKVEKNCTPIAVSNYGDYVYGIAKDSNGIDNLYVITTKDEESTVIENSTGIMGIIDMNVDGDEILFCSSNGTDCNTFIYNTKKNTTSSLAKYMLSPVITDPTIAIYDTFKNVYMAGYSLDGTKAITGYVDKDFKWNNIVRAVGKIDAEANYLYYVNEDLSLIQLDLNDKDNSKNRIDDDVVDFTITEKGNVYSLNKDKQLRFYKASTDDKDRIADDVGAISIYSYANEVYFSDAEAVDVTIYTSKEGSDKDIAKLDSTQITSVPTFSDVNSKKTYAYYYDIDYGWMLFYTSNGKSFKLISDDCQALNGVDIPDIIG